MRGLLVLLALFLVSAAVAPAQEQPQTPVVIAPPESPPPPVPIKVATLFAQNAIISTREGQKASAALNAKFAPRKDQFARKQTELQSLRDQLKRGQATMSTDVKARLNQAIDDKTKEMQRLGEDSQAALEQEEGAMLQELGEKLLGVVREYASRNGYAVVIDVSLPNGPVLWASPSVDITNDIVKLYDQAHPAAAPSALPVKK